MFLRLVVVFFFTVYLASCETEKKSQGPPLLEALNAKYFGHIRGKRTVSKFNINIVEIFMAQSRLFSILI